jgi:hypothetical protein
MISTVAYWWLVVAAERSAYRLWVVGAVDIQPEAMPLQVVAVVLKQAVGRQSTTMDALLPLGAAPLALADLAVPISKAQVVAVGGMVAVVRIRAAQVAVLAIRPPEFTCLSPAVQTLGTAGRS